MPLYDYLLIHPYGSSGDIPTSPDVSYFYRPDITDVEALADFITVGLAFGSRIDTVMDNVLKSWLLQPEPADGGHPGQVAPEHYNVDTNNVHWTLMGGSRYYLCSHFFL